MWPYWIMLLIPALLAMVQPPARVHPIHRSRLWTLEWWATFAVLVILIGWRHQVGGDWFSYINSYELERYQQLSDIWAQDDPGYRLLEFLARALGMDIYAINFMAALIFSFGLISFCQGLPRPWLALTAAIPYIVIILGMGYTRQGVALGCLMAGLTSLGRERIAPFLLWTLVGATFHKSAVLLLPVAALAASRRRLVTLAWVLIIAAAAYQLLLAESVSALHQNYVEAEYQSEGALVRLLMNMVPAGLVLIYRHQLRQIDSGFRIWLWLALFSFLFLIALAISPSSTAVDRVALYLLPIQLYAFAHLPHLMQNRLISENLIVGTIIVYYAAVQYVWLNYAVNAWAWIPYQNLLTL